MISAAFFEVSDERQQDTAYFGQIHRWLDSGGTAHLRYYLEHKDISGWHPRQRPSGVSGAGVRFASVFRYEMVVPIPRG